MGSRCVFFIDVSIYGFCYRVLKLHFVFLESDIFPNKSYCQMQQNIPDKFFTLSLSAVVPA